MKLKKTSPSQKYTNHLKVCACVCKKNENIEEKTKRIFDLTLADLDKFTYFEDEEDRDLIGTLLYKAYTEGIEFMNNKMEAQIQKWEEMQSENMRSE